MNQHFHSLKISRLRQETEQAVVVCFHVPAELTDAFTFKQGQYLTLRAEIDGEMLQRSYSICSGVDDGVLRVAIKLVPDGIFSTWANQSLSVGERIDVMAPNGNFFTGLEPAEQRNYLCICAGSGITPMISIMKTVLTREPLSKITLIYGNQRTATMMFRNELAFLKNRFMQRFHWINIFSREPQEAEVLTGRINNRKGGELNQRLITINEFDEFFLCGPEAMMSEVSRGLRGEGIDEQHIHFELFASSADDARKVIEKHHERAQLHKGVVSDVTIMSGGREYSFELNADGENILDAGIRNAIDLPFSCKGGICATCRARLREGEVDMDLTQGLSREELDKGYILTCQSHPVSKKVVIDYDDF